MSYMFSDASAFNQEIRNWIVQDGDNLINMFLGATAFNILYSAPNTPDASFFIIPITNSNIQTAVDLWIADEEDATIIYGDISGWDTSEVTYMSELFKDKTTFNSNISGWNVSNVTDMSNMFYNASAFNQDIGSWDVSSVTNMNGMLSFTVVFNQDIGSLSLIHISEPTRPY